MLDKLMLHFYFEFPNSHTDTRQSLRYSTDRSIHHYDDISRGFLAATRMDLAVLPKQVGHKYN